MRFGARIIKTGIAVVLAYYICMWLSLEPPLIAVVAAVLTTQPSLYMSFRLLVDQLQANVIGALAAIGAYAVLGNEPVVIGLTVMVVIALNMLLRLESSIVLAIFTVVAVMDDPSGAVNRFVLVMLGVVLAILVNAVFFPPNHERQFREKLHLLHDRLLPLLRNMLDDNFTLVSLGKEKDELESELKKANDLFQMYKEEREIYRKHRKLKQHKLVIYRNMLETLRLELRLLHLLERELPEPWREPLREGLQEITHAHELIGMQLDGMVKIRQPADQRLAHVMKGLQQRLFADPEHSASRPPATLVRIMGVLIALEERLERLNKQVAHYAAHRMETRQDISHEHDVI